MNFHLQIGAIFCGVSEKARITNKWLQRQDHNSRCQIKEGSVRHDRRSFLWAPQTCSWLFDRLKGDTSEANVIKLRCAGTSEHPEGLSLGAGAESSAPLEALPQTAPGNQAVTHIWVAPHTNGIAFRDEELARKKQQPVLYH